MLLNIGVLRGREARPTITLLVALFELNRAKLLLRRVHVHAILLVLAVRLSIHNFTKGIGESKWL